MERPEEQAQEPVEAKPKSGLVGLVVLATGSLATAFATVYLLTPAEAGEVPACAPGTVIASEARPASRLVSSDKTYVELEEILVTIGSAPATRYLKLQLSVVTDKSRTNAVRDAQPVLKDAFINYLRSVDLDDFEDPGFYTEMREQLARRAELVLGSAVSEGVLITEFLLR